MKTAAVLSILLLAIFASACGREDDNSIASDTATTTGPVLDETTRVPAGEPVQPQTDAGATVLVMLQDTTISMATSDIPPGPTVFTVTNSGTETHDLTLEGNEIAVELEGTLAPNESKTMSVDLKPGTYELYCPILDHRDRGQRLELKIPAP